MLKYDLYIFDWDGTLMNTTQTIVDAITYACRTLGLNVISDELAKLIIGKNFTQVIAEIIPELRSNPALVQKFTAVYEQYLNENALRNSLFACVLETLDKLTWAGKFIALATGSSRARLNDILAATGLAHYFMLIKTACECFSKPHPQMIEEILDFTGMTQSQAVMIGDTSHDLQMAHNAGVDAIAISHGAQDYAELAVCNPRYLLRNISELYELLV